MTWFGVDVGGTVTDIVVHEPAAGATRMMIRAHAAFGELHDPTAVG